MNEGEMLEALFSYCQSPGTDYAVLINGEWGTGKSHFWRVTAEPHLVDKGITPFYISLHGARGTEEISAFAMLALAPLVGKKIPRGLVRIAMAALEKYRATGILEEILAKLDKTRSIFCFDDLERARDLESALAFVASLAEGGTKVIVVGAEEEILGDRDQEATYRRRKEKVIGQTLDFSPNREALMQTMIPGTVRGKRAQEFLQRYSTQLIELIWSEDDSPNLRSVRHGLRMFERIETRISGRTRAHDALRFDLLRLCIGLAIELPADIQNREFLSTISEPDFSPAFVVDLVNRLGVGQRADIFAIFNFLRTYGIRTPGAPKYAAIYAFALSGRLNEEQLGADVEEHLNLLSGRKIDGIKAVLTDFSILQDDDFRKAAQALLITLANKNITDAVEIYRAVQRLAFSSVNRLIDKDLGEVLDIAESVVANLSATGQLVGQEVNWAEPMFRHGDIEDERYLAFCNSLIDYNAAALLSRLKLELKELFDEKGRNASDIVAQLRLKFPPTAVRATLPLFHAIDHQQLLNCLARSKNVQIGEFMRYVDERYRGFAYKIPHLELVKRLPRELGALRKLEEMVRGQSAGREGQLSAVILRDLANSLRNAINVVKNIEDKLQNETQRAQRL